MPPTRRQAIAQFSAFLAASPLARGQQPPPALADRAPSLEEVTSIFDFEPIARQKVPRAAYDYVVGGIDGEFSIRRNRKAFDYVSIVPSPLTAVTKPDTGIELFGIRMPYPILVAPTGSQGRMHPEGELAMHQGATAAEALMIVSSASSFPIEKIAPAAKGPLWFQLYATDTPEGTQERVERAQDAGCRAVCLTADTQYYSHRERLLHDRNLGENPPAQRSARARRGAPPNPYRISPQTPDLDWNMLKTLRKYTKVPLLLKGVMTAEDAKMAAELGFDGLVVSNHGARYLDYVDATIEVLPEVVDAVRGRIPVLVDGGFRRGSDVFKALAIGAKAVCLGRATVWGLGAFGAPGAERAIRMVQSELELAMIAAGRTSLKSIDRSAVRYEFP